jgi:hypothetical protein
VHDTLDRLDGLHLIEDVGGSDSAGNFPLVQDTLDRPDDLHLIEGVGGLPDLLSDVVASTLGQIIGLVGNAGELTAVVGGALENSLNVAFRATESLVTQAGESVASSVGTLASTVTDLGLLGDVGHVLSDGTVSQIVYTASSQAAGMQLVEDASSALGNTLNALAGQSADALNTSNMGTPALNIVSDVPELASLGHNQDVSSGGTIAFPDLTSANVHQLDDLFTGGRYTDYGLTLQSDVNSGVTAIADALNNDADGSTSSSPIDSPTDSQGSALAPGAQDVDVSSVNLPSTIEELGVRDLSI